MISAHFVSSKISFETLASASATGDDESANTRAHAAKFSSILVFSTSPSRSMRD